MQKNNTRLSVAKGRSRGTHILVDFFGVEKKKLRDRKALLRLLLSALKKGGFHVVRETGSHKFRGGGQGVTGFVLLAESHAAFHTYPEYNYMAFDIYSCGKCDPRLITEEIRRYLKPLRASSVFHERG